MTIGTTTVSLSALQTEFGGANPISLHEYYAGAGLVANPAPTSGNQSAIIPAGGAIKLSNFRGVTAVVPSVSTASWNNSSITATATTHPSDIDAIFEIYAIFSVDGQFILAAFTNSTFDPTQSFTYSISGVTQPTTWYAPTASGVGNNYWVRASLVSGSLSGNSGATLGVWHQLNFEKYFGYFADSDSGGTPPSILQFDISNNSSGFPIVGTGQVHFALSIT